jgi:tripartite-type tricarboxylate transporter receptor subunit TctC
MKRTLVALAASLALVAAMPVAAQDASTYPNRPIRLVVPHAPGPGDIVPRLFVDRLAAKLGQPIVLENRPGATFNIASEIVAKAPPDGYTLLYSSSAITLLPQIMGPTAVDPIASLTPLAKVLTIPVIVVVNPASGLRSLDDLVARARAQPGRVAYATIGVGSLQHLVGTMIANRAGVDLLHVPYANMGQATANVVAGEVPAYVTFYSQVAGQLKSGALLPIAVASAARTSVLPDVPTTVELGYPDVTVEPWAGFFAPAGTRPLRRNHGGDLDAVDEEVRLDLHHVAHLGGGGHQATRDDAPRLLGPGGSPRP